jgi:hypothetical protein
MVSGVLITTITTLLVIPGDLTPAALHGGLFSITANS